MDFQAEQVLPVAIAAGVIYLLKIGGLSAIALALRKLWKRLRQGKEE